MGKLRKELFERGLFDLLLVYLGGFLLVGGGILGLLDPLPFSLYNESGNTEAWRYLSVMVGGAGLVVLGNAIWATISYHLRFRRKK